MKSFMYKLLSIGVVAGLVAGCHPKTAEEDAVLFGIASSQITGLAEGNCAISINHAGLTYGTYVNIAINRGAVSQLNPLLSLASAAFSGVFAAVAAANSVETFTDANFLAAVGADAFPYEGFANYNAVPYNIKYDAFFTDRGAWTAAKRNALLNLTKEFYETFAVISGGSASIASFVQSPAYTTPGVKKSAIDGVFYNIAVPNGFPPACQTAPGGVNSFGLALQRTQNITTNVPACDAIPQANALALFAPTNSPIAAMGGVGIFSAVNGTAALACARIPRANCSVRALTTADQKTDIEDAKAVKKTLLSNPLCALEPSNELLFANLVLFQGAPSDVQIANGLPSAFFSPSSALDSILGEKMYPKFGTLVSLGFGNLMPIQSGSRAFELDAQKYVRGANLNATVVSSCESIGITKGTSNVKDLSPVSEVVYAFSNPGKAAAIFDAAVANTPGSSNRAVACNSSFRRIVNENLPLALKNAGVQIDTNVVATSGNGGATETLGVCVYGGDTAKRGAAKTLLGAGLNATVNDCDPTKALSVVRANRFGDPGVTSFKANAANNAIDGE